MINLKYIIRLVWTFKVKLDSWATSINVMIEFHISLYVEAHVNP